MNDPLGNIEFEELLARVIAGEADAEERARLEQAVASSEQYRKQFERSRIVWEKSERPKPRPRFNVDTAWQKLDHRIAAAEDRQNIRKQGLSSEEPAGSADSRRSSTWSWRIAASVILLAGIAAFVYLLMRPTAQPVTLTASAGKLEKTMSDGSSVALNTNATLTYPEEFGSKQRKVKLKGEAFFRITPDAKKPFIVEAENAEITVVGTAFNVETSEEKVEVLVTEGIVKLAPKNADTMFVMLRAGETGILDRQHATVKKIEAVQENDLFWRTGKLTFKDVSLAQVVRDLNEAYGSNINLQNDSIANCRLTTTFQNDSLPDVLRVIALTLDLKVIPQANQILLDGKGCQ